MKSGLAGYLRCVHASAQAVGVEALCRQAGMPDARSVYRWHREFGNDLIYFPRIALQALGFVHLHIFTDEPLECAFAVRARWVVRSPGRRTLYLQCVVPAALASAVTSQFDRQEVTIITTTDGWQTLGERNATVPRCTPDAQDLIERYPLLVPAIFESIEARVSYPDLWETIRERLGNRVWEYLPRFSRRLPHNGKHYISEAFRILTDAHLVGQHAIRYAPWDAEGIELYVQIDAGTDDVLQALNDAIAVEIYPSADGVLAHLYAPLPVLARLLSATLTLPITNTWFVDRATNEREPLHPRVAYERLFDPATGTWVIE